MELFEAIAADAAEPAVAEALHRLDHAGALDVLRVAREDLARRRLRGFTEGGCEVAVALPRDTQLFDGAVLRLDAAGALVVRVEAEAWLRLRPADAAAALALGHSAGHLHWRVRFEGADLLVALEGPADAYRARIAPLLDGARVAEVGP